MITSFWFVFIGGIIGNLVNLLPIADPLPASLQAAIYAINGAIQLVGFLFAFDTLFACLLIVFAIEAAIFTFKGANWLLNKIRGAG